MKVLISELATNRQIEATISPATIQDLKLVTRKNFGFKWQQQKGHELYKLTAADAPNEILGMLSINCDPEMQVVEINLVEARKQDVGKRKAIDRIGACLIAFACHVSFIKGCSGAVFLVSKTEIALKLYAAKYGFVAIHSPYTLGQGMFLNEEHADKLIKKYL